MLGRELYEELGLGPWHQHVGGDREAVAGEPALAEELRDGRAVGGPLREEPLGGRQLGGGELGIVDEEPFALDIGSVGDEQSASSLGVSIPARRDGAPSRGRAGERAEQRGRHAGSVAERWARRVGGCARGLDLLGLLGEARAALVGLQGIGELVELAVEGLVERVQRELDAVIGHAALAIVVGADLLGAVAVPTWALRPAESSPAARRWPAQGAGRSTRMAFSRFCSWLFSSCIATATPVGLCVMRTAESVVFTDWPRVRRSGTVDLQIALVDLDVDLFGLRQHRDGGGGGVDPALRLGGGTRCNGGCRPRT